MPKDLRANPGLDNSQEVLSDHCLESFPFFREALLSYDLASNLTLDHLA